MNMERLKEKYFYIMNSKGSQSIIFRYSKVDKKPLIEKLDTMDEILNEGKSKRTFYLTNPLPEGDDLIIVTINNNKVIINTALLMDNSLKFSKSYNLFSRKIIKYNKTVELKFDYVTEDLRKDIVIIDIKEKKEIVPICYFDKEAGRIRGKYRIEANVNYIVLKTQKAKTKISKNTKSSAKDKKY